MPSAASRTACEVHEHDVGTESVHLVEGITAVLRLADDLEVESGGEERLESFADHLVVVGDEDPGAMRFCHVVTLPALPNATASTARGRG